MRIAQFTLPKYSSPQSTRWLLSAIAMAVLGPSILSSFAQGQELRNAIRDYRDERVFDYRPDDPQHRGKLFNIHTKHYGRFYNCDSQEDKRNSPYICWKPHHENDFPARLGFCENLRRDIAEIKQRISDGAGPCGGSCDCQECQPNHWQQTTQPHQPVYNQSNCPCARRAVTGATQANSFVASTETPSRNLNVATKETQSSCDCPTCKLKAISSQKSGYAGGTADLANQPRPDSSRISNQDWAATHPNANRSYGLVSGKILQPTTVSRRMLPKTQYKQVDVVARLPFEPVAQAVDPPSPQATAKARLKAQTSGLSKTTSPVQASRSSAPRVVEKTEFWNKFKVF